MQDAIATKERALGLSLAGTPWWWAYHGYLPPGGSGCDDRTANNDDRELLRRCSRK
ncbi:hypothetical protein MMC06_006227 [Schaereria dolodes]|nr:hypothetical protein [Schaereria dolodes]